MDKRMYNMITKKTNNLNNSLTNNYVTDVASLLESCKTKSRKLTNKQFTPSALIIVASNGVNPLEWLTLPSPFSPPESTDNAFSNFSISLQEMARNRSGKLDRNMHRTVNKKKWKKRKEKKEERREEKWSEVKRREEKRREEKRGEEKKGKQNKMMG